jgi:hypothetical protein
MIISPTACKKLLGGSSSLSDKDCELLLDQLTVLANIAIDQYEQFSNQSSSSSEAFNDMLKLVPPTDRDYIYNKARDIEAESGVGRDVAERLSLGDYVAWRCGKLSCKRTR